jgi:hypothetical protein
MQKNSSSRRAGRKRKSWSEYDLDEEYEDITPIKRSRRLSALSFTEYKTHCEKILTALMQHENAWPFNTPVDPVQLDSRLLCQDQKADGLGNHQGINS